MEKKFVGQEYMAATNGKGLHQQSKGNRILGRTTIIFSTVITIVSVMIVAFCIFFQLCPINGTSMMTTLNATGEDTDSALTCVVGEPQHGDIIVMKLYIQDSHRRDKYLAAKGDPDALRRIQLTNPFYTQENAISEIKNYIQNDGYTEADSNGNYKLVVKRLIAKGGDYLSMRAIGDKYYIYLNGIELDESYLDPLVAEHNATNFKQLWQVLNTPEIANMDDWVTTDYNQLLEDNTFKNSDNKGTPSAYQLHIPANHYFIMGDNRGGAKDTHPKWAYSWDSTRFGPLPTSSYYSYCVDVISNQTSMPEYLWDKFVYYVCFGWAWQK